MNTFNKCLINFILEVEEILVQLVCDICVSFTTALLLLYYCFTTASESPCLQVNPKP